MKGVRWALIFLSMIVMFGCARGTKPPPSGTLEKARVYHKKGVSLSREGRFQKALSAFKKAVSLDPDYGKAYYNMGIAYTELDRVEKAIEAYRTAIEINPRDAAAHMNLGNVFLRQGQLSAAVIELEEAVKIDPTYGLARHNLAYAYFSARMYHRAWDQLNELELLGIAPEADLRDAVAAALNVEQGAVEEEE